MPDQEESFPRTRISSRNWKSEPARVLVRLIDPNSSLFGSSTPAKVTEIPTHCPPLLVEFGFVILYLDVMEQIVSSLLSMMRGGHIPPRRNKLGGAMINEKAGFGLPRWVGRPGLPSRSRDRWRSGNQWANASADRAGPVGTSAINDVPCGLPMWAGIIFELRPTMRLQAAFRGGAR